MCVLFITRLAAVWTGGGTGRGRAGRRVKVEFITTKSTRGGARFPSDSFSRFGDITDGGKCVRALNRSDGSRVFSIRLHIDDFYYHPVKNVLHLAVIFFLSNRRNRSISYRQFSINYIHLICYEKCASRTVRPASRSTVPSEQYHPNSSRRVVATRWKANVQ